MGCTFSVEFPETLIDFGRVYCVSPSQVYNFFQESLIRPRGYVFYDARERDSFNRHSVKHAIWAWDGVGKLPISEGEKSEFYKRLRDQTCGRTVVVMGTRTRCDRVLQLLGHLVNCRSEARLLCLLKGGFKRLQKERYRVILANSDYEYKGPIEILPSPKLRSGGPSLFATGADTLFDQKDMMGNFDITAVVNLSSLTVRPGVHLDVFSSKSGTPDLLRVAQCIKNHMKERRAIVIIDDFGGGHFAAVACVAYLVLEGVDIEEAIHFVKEKKPSADMNHLMSIHSVAIPNDEPRESGLAKLFKKRRTATWIPADALDKGDDDEEYIEIVERYMPETIPYDAENAFGP